MKLILILLTGGRYRLREPTYLAVAYVRLGWRDLERNLLNVVDRARGGPTPD